MAHKIRLHVRGGKGTAESFSREKLRQSSQKQGGEILCDPGWYVNKPDVQNKWNGRTTHTHYERDDWYFSFQAFVCILMCPCLPHGETAPDNPPHGIFQPILWGGFTGGGVFFRGVAAIACSLDHDMTSALTTGIHVYTFQFPLCFLDPMVLWARLKSKLRSENHNDSGALASLSLPLSLSLFLFIYLEHCGVGSHYLADERHQAPINKMDV